MREAMRLNLPTSLFSSVEAVERVTNEITHSALRDKSECTTSKNHSTDTVVGSVENVTKNDLTSYFSTLSTKVKIKSVEVTSSTNNLNVNGLGYFPQNPQVPHEKTNESIESQELDRGRLRAIFAWMGIIMEEGHIEASQPLVGKIVGWPCRAFSVNSLFIDFEFWCYKQGILEWQMPSKIQFYALPDQLFHRVGDTYQFPSLDICRKKFRALKRDYESS